MAVNNTEFEGNPTIVAYTDGASRRKANYMSWAYVVYVDNKEFYNNSGVVRDSTNNKMEMTAMLELLSSLNGVSGEVIHICSDSKYLLCGLTHKFTSIQTGEITQQFRWLDLWEKTDWKSSTGNDVLNKELWIQLDEKLQQLSKHNIVRFFHTKGHCGVIGNERADELCNLAIEKYVVDNK